MMKEFVSAVVCKTDREFHMKLSFELVKTFSLYLSSETSKITIKNKQTVLQLI